MYTTGRIRIQAGGVFFIVFVILVAAPMAFCDGYVSGERMIKKPPSMPIQRAVISYKDGVERLIIEPVVRGEGDSFGWIVPVPASPTKIKKASQDLFNYLSLTFKPKIHPGRGFSVAIILFPLLLLWLLLGVVDYVTRSKLADLLFTIITALLILFVLLLPNVATYSGDFIYVRAGVKVENTQQVGNYEVSVLEAARAEDLNQWLVDNGFNPVPQEGLSIVSDYINAKWKFMAAKLRRDSQQDLIPHPLSITFPTLNPVYPMRLTKLNGSDLYVELYVIADQRAATDGFILEYANTLRKVDFKEGTFGYGLPNFLGTSYSTHVMVPILTDLLWDRCVVSRLSTTLHPDDMNTDFTIHLDGGSPRRMHFYTTRAAVLSAILWGGLFCCAGLILIAYRTGPIREHRFRIFVKFDLFIVAILVAGGLIGLARYRMITPVEIDYPEMGFMYIDWDFLNSISLLDTKTWDGKTREEIETLLYEGFRRFGHEINMQRYEGLYTIKEDKDGIVLWAYEFYLSEQGLETMVDRHMLVPGGHLAPSPPK